MKKYLFILGPLVLFFIVFNVILLSKCKEKEDENSHLIEDYHKISIDNFMVKKQVILQQAAESEDIEDLKLTTLDNDRKISLSSLVKNRNPTLFFRFRETDCKVCVQNTLQIINKILEQIPEKDIIILSGYKNARQFYAANKETPKLRVYNIENQSLPLDVQSQPYFFVITEKRRMHNVFIPLKGNDNFTMEYLLCIKNKYWHTQSPE